MHSSLTFQTAQEATGGRWLCEPSQPERPLVGAAFDTRRLGAEEIFFALDLGGGDGHQFLHLLENSQIKLAVVHKEALAPKGIATLRVEDTLKALHQMAHWRATYFTGRILALTGSSGKTTTKTWLNHFIGPVARVQSNPGSFNNHIGCPVTLLGLLPETELLILEMGTSGPGELDLLSSIAPPDVTLLLNVGHAHLGKFGSAEALLEAKLEIFNHHRAGARQIIPGWDARITERLGPKALRFGPESCRWAERLPTKRGGAQRFKLHGPMGPVEVEVPHPGDYVGDLLCAIYGVFEALDLPLKALAENAATLPQERGRSTLLEGAQGTQLLDDSYNANPESLVNMLQTLTGLEGERFVACVGNLAEMDEGLKESRSVILEGLPKKLTHLFLGGETGQLLAPLVREARPDLVVVNFKQPLELLAPLEPLLGPKTVIGIKGSRSAHMERLTLALQGCAVTCRLSPCSLLVNCADCPELKA